MEEVLCIQCEKQSNHRYTLQCKHSLCSKCLIKAILFSSFKNIPELGKITIVCNCQQSKTEMKTEEIIAFIQKANGITNLSNILSTKPNSKTGLQHESYQSFLKNILSIEKKYLSECSEDYLRKKTLISNSIIQIAAIGKNFKSKFEKAFQRAKRFCMLLKISLYDYYNISEEDITELINVDDIQFKSNLNDEYVNIANIYKTLKNQKEFSTRIVLNHIPLLNDDKKDSFKWLFHLKEDKNEVIEDMKLNKPKSERKLIKLNPNHNIDIDNVIINDYSNTIYDLMKLKETDVYDQRYKLINKEFRWVSKVHEIELIKKNRLCSLNEMTNVANVEYNHHPIKQVIDYHHNDDFSIQKLYNRYDNNAINSSFVELLSMKKGFNYKLHYESEMQIKAEPKIKKPLISQENRFDLIPVIKEENNRRELVFVYDSKLKQLVIKNEDKNDKKKDDNYNGQVVNRIEHNNDVLTNKELIEFISTTNIFEKGFDQSSMTRSSFIPFKYDNGMNNKLSNLKLIQPINTLQFFIAKKENNTVLEFSHSCYPLIKPLPKYEHSQAINQVVYYSNIRRFPLNAFILESKNFFIKRKPILMYQPSIINHAFSLSCLNHFIKDKLVFNSNHSFELSINNKSIIKKTNILHQLASSVFSLSLLSSKLSPSLKIEALKPLELIQTIKHSHLQPLQIFSLNQFTIALNKEKDCVPSYNSSKSTYSMSNIIIELNRLESNKSINILETNLSQLNKKDEENKTIQHYRNNILSSLFQYSFRLELTKEKDIKEPTKPSFLSTLTSMSKNNALKSTNAKKKPQTANQRSISKRNHPIVLKESLSLHNAKKTNEVISKTTKENKVNNSNSMSSNEVVSPLVPKRQISVNTKKFKSSNQIEPYKPPAISSKETEFDFQQKALSPDINPRKLSFTFSFSSGSKEIISNFNELKINEQINVSRESTSINNKIKDSSLNCLSEHEINLMNEIGQSEINPFEDKLPITPKIKKKEMFHLTEEGIKNKNYEKKILSPNLQHSYNNIQYDDESETNLSRWNTSHYLLANKSSHFFNRQYTPAGKKIPKGVTIPLTSIIVSSKNTGSNAKQIKKYSSFCPYEDNNLKEGIKSVIQLNDNKIAYCSYNSNEIIIILQYQNKDLEDKIILKKHTKQVNMIINIPNEKIASCSADSSLIIWNTDTYQSEKILYDRNKGDILCLTYISNSIIVAASFWTIHVYDIDKEVELFSLIGHNKSIISIVKLSDDEIASSSLESTTKLWHLKEKKELSSIFASKSGITAMVSISSKQIGMGMGDNSLIIFKTHPLMVKATLKGHAAEIVYLLKINQTSLASSSKDLSIIIWNLKSMFLEMKFDKRSSLVNCMSLLKNGNILVASTESTLEEIIIRAKSIQSTHQ